MTEHSHRAPGSDLRDFLRPIRAHRWLIAIVVITTTASTYAYNERKPDQFRASTQIFLQASEVDQSLYGPGPALEGDRNVVNQASLLQTPAVAREVAEQTGFPGDPGELLTAVTVTPSQGSDFLVVSAVDDTPAGAAELANAFATAFINLRATATKNAIKRALGTARRQLALLPRTAATRASRETLQTRISSLEAIQSLAPGGASQVDRAVAPSVRSSPQPVRTALFGFVLSLVFAVLAAFGLERLNRKVKHLDHVGPAYRAPLLAALPHVRAGALARSHGASPEIVPPFREAVRGLRTNLLLASPEKPLRTFLVTSALAGEGKSTLVLNLALAYAEAGLRVAIVECDLRLPAMAKLIAVKPSPGLTDVLSGESELTAAVQEIELATPVAVSSSVAAEGGPNGSGPSGAPGLTVLTAGPQPADPSSALATPRMAQILESTRDSADVVIIDAPPLLAVADALPLLGAVDATIVVARIGTTNRSTGRRLRETIDRIPGASLLGVVANDVRGAELADGYYGYGGDYGAAANGRTPAVAS